MLDQEHEVGDTVTVTIGGWIHPVSGKPVTVTGTALHRIAGGKIAQTWQVWNLAAILPQIGAMPATGTEVFDWGETLGVVAGATGTLEENKGIVQLAISRVFNPYRPERFGEVFHPDYRHHAPGNPTLTFESTRSFFDANAIGFPDMCVIIHDLVAEGDKVVKRWHGTATHLGPYAGVDPTGNAVLFQGITIYRIAGGQVADIWWGQDTLSVLRTLGLVPS